MLEISRICTVRGRTDKEILKGINLTRERRRSPRDHGPERLGQEHARARAVRASRIRGHRRRGPVRGQGPARHGSGRARPRRRVHGVPVPGRDPRREQRLLPQGGAERRAQAPRRAGARRDGVHGSWSRRRRSCSTSTRACCSRAVNEGFSGGEKKRNEIFQMAVLEPKLAILDETDSGLDIDALKIVASGVNAMRSPGARHHRRHALPAPARLHRARLRPRAQRRPDRRSRAARSWRWSSRRRATAGSKPSAQPVGA